MEFVACALLAGIDDDGLPTFRYHQILPMATLVARRARELNLGRWADQASETGWRVFRQPVSLASAATGRGSLTFTEPVSNEVTNLSLFLCDKIDFCCSIYCYYLWVISNKKPDPSTCSKGIIFVRTIDRSACS